MGNVIFHQNLRDKITIPGTCQMLGASESCFCIFKSKSGGGQKPPLLQADCQDSVLCYLVGSDKNTLIIL